MIGDSNDLVVNWFGVQVGGGMPCSAESRAPSLKRRSSETQVRRVPAAAKRDHACGFLSVRGYLCKVS